MTHPNNYVFVTSITLQLLHCAKIVDVFLYMYVLMYVQYDYGRELSSMNSLSYTHDAFDGMLHT